MGRPPCCDKVGVKKGPWTPEEDIILVSYIQENGPGNWRAVPANTGLLRCSKSCRLRWTNYLRPGIKRGNFTPQEEGMIVHLQSLLGNKWAAIASYLPQRTDNDIKNYWNTHLKKKLKKATAEPIHSREPSSKEGSNGVGVIKASDIVFSASTYASSTQNISRLLEGWMRSSPQTGKPSSKAANNDASSTSLRHVTKQEMPSNKEEPISHDHYDYFDPFIYENLNLGGMSEQRKMKAQVSTPPFSFIEKWLLEEHTNAQIEEVLEMSSIFG